MKLSIRQLKRLIQENLSEVSGFTTGKSEEDSVFESSQDAVDLFKAMKGLGTDEKVVENIFKKRAGDLINLYHEYNALLLGARLPPDPYDKATKDMTRAGMRDDLDLMMKVKNFIPSNSYIPTVWEMIGKAGMPESYFVDLILWLQGDGMDKQAGEMIGAVLGDRIKNEKGDVGKIPKDKQAIANEVAAIAKKLGKEPKGDTKTTMTQEPVPQQPLQSDPAYDPATDEEISL